MDRIPRMKTSEQCIKAIRELDKTTALSEWFIRCLCKEGKVKCFFTGRKILVNYESLLEFLNMGENQNSPIDPKDT